MGLPSLFSPHRGGEAPAVAAAAAAGVVDDGRHPVSKSDAESGHGRSTTASVPVGGGGGVGGSGSSTRSGGSEDAISVDAQAGVQQVEATTSVWTAKHIIWAYILIWVIFFVDSMQQGMTGAFLPYVTSSFRQHSLTATTGIMAQLLGGLLKLPLAKILDIWGRPQGFALTTGMLTIGLAMMAACQNVQTYAAAQVFYWVGFNGMSYSLSVFIADTSALRNRALMFAFLYSPFIFTTWIGGPLATSFLKGAGWRWGFGIFAVVTPVMSVPLIALFAYNLRKARARGLLPGGKEESSSLRTPPSASASSAAAPGIPSFGAIHNDNNNNANLNRQNTRRTLAQTVCYYCIQFDIIGLLLIAGGLALFLLPFSLYTYQPRQWQSPLIIGMLIGGILLILAFTLYERFLAPVQFVPYSLMADRTIAGAMVLAAVVFVAFYIWDIYFTSFLQVVNGLSITNASYVAKVHNIVSCFWGLIVGLLIRLSGRFKWLALYFGAPLLLLGTGLMIHFRQPHVQVGYVVMCQVFIAVAGGTISITEQMAVMASVSHQHIAVILAVQSLFYSVGGAIGSTVAAALWTGIFPRKLAEYLPPETQPNLAAIYGNLTAQLSYPMGSPTREAIVRAYGDTQRLMLITAVGVLSLSLVSIAVWRDIRVKDFKQVKGLVV